MKKQETHSLLFEKLASIEHERWAKWQRYMHSKMEPSAKDGIWQIGEEHIKRWERQINTPYKDLSEEEKESDREQVRSYWYEFFPKQPEGIKKQANQKSECFCAHTLEQHGKSHSINVATGRCQECVCTHFHMTAAGGRYDYRHDSQIIDQVIRIIGNGTFRIETINEALLVKMLELRGTPIPLEYSARDIEEDWKVDAPFEW